MEGRNEIIPAPAGLRRWAARMFGAAADRNVANILRLTEAEPPSAALVDLGCDDGSLTARIAAAARTEDVHGVELVRERANLARSRGVDVHIGDLNGELPFEDGRFGIVVSNQVLEHLADTDTFVEEILRILAPGGAAIISTENLASWHNIASLALGWQPFSLGNVSRTSLGLGNPLAVHRGGELGLESWQHLRVFAFRGLRELFAAHGFVLESTLAAGYFPLPAAVARLDPRHGAFLTVKARKPRA